MSAKNNVNILNYHVGQSINVMFLKMVLCLHARRENVGLNILYL